MRKISITTAQNIVIDFKLATIGQRFLAFAIDMIILATASTFLSIFLSFIHPDLLMVSGLLFLLYTLIMELIFSGQTLGKMALKIRVVSIEGKEPHPLDFVIRWSFRIIDIWFSVGALAVVMISTSTRAQRLGGVLSNTMVVNLSSESGLSLRDILRIEDRSKYEPQYFDVIRFSEDEMLTVKAVLDRYAKYRNKAHLNLLETTASRCGNVLELTEIPENKIEFLRTLIKDYIVITRS
ncbi:RDD family protein [Cryomorphaceae bacterium 1068]|nr:RDD family protein [Cryomorphaceae bacterium 1068]